MIAGVFAFRAENLHGAGSTRGAYSDTTSPGRRSVRRPAPAAAGWRTQEPSRYQGHPWRWTGSCRRSVRAAALRLCRRRQTWRRR